MNLLNIIKKQGGLKLFKQYFISGTLLTAINQFVVLGKGRTALEILRLSTQYKIKQKLYKKYRKKLLEFDNNYDNNREQKHNDIIWVCWLQGIENAPDIVKKCYQSLLNIENRKVVLITEENLVQYVNFPQYIEEKWKNGIITNTHLTDLLRLELLTQYGGLWVDATVLCTNPKIPDYIDSGELFLYQNLKPGKDGHAIYVSSWLISSKSHNRVLEATKYLCYEYWKKNNYMIDYFLIHHFISIVLEYYENDWKKIIPVDNTRSHILLLRLFDRYDDKIWNYLKQEIPFHKLSYKFDKEDMYKNDTYYWKIMN